MLQTFEEPKTCVKEVAYVMINCEDGGEQEVKEKIRSIDGITEVIHTIGAYDIVVKIATPSVEELRETIVFKIRQIPKIRTTTTIVCGSLTSFVKSA
jgi:DNA-binding Lrp family transcriptional regulator